MATRSGIVCSNQFSNSRIRRWNSDQIDKVFSKVCLNAAIESDNHDPFTLKKKARKRKPIAFLVLKHTFTFEIFCSSRRQCL